MKRFLTLSFLCLLVSASVSAQVYDVLDKVQEDWRKCWAMEGPHRFETAPLSKAPKGYKPFYISHYGRHGSRYSSSSRTYETLWNAFSQAHEAGLLTPLGEDFYKKYADFYTIPLVNTGDLVPLGFEQHKKLGLWTYDNFKKVFKGKKRVDAVVSTAQRSILSMSSFCLSLKGRNPKLDIYQESNHMDMRIAAPTSAPRQFARYFKGQFDQPAGESHADFGARIVDYPRIIGTFFTDPSYPDQIGIGGRTLVTEMQNFLMNYHNYCDEDIFDSFISREDMLKLWEVNNYGSYTVDQTARYGNIPLLEDIIDKADAAFNTPDLAANLRFGHDYVVEAFMCLINANGCGTIPEKADDVKYWFQSYNIPMACTVIFAFYRNRKGDVLFKLIWNEEEARLPQLEAVTGNYYRWTDFKDWAYAMIAEHPEVERPAGARN